MRKIAIASQKGGVGKTTTTVNTAAALGELNRKTLILDLDPQHNASDWLKANNGGPCLLNVLTDNANLSECIVQTKFKNVSIVPSSDWLQIAEKRLIGQIAAEMSLKNALVELHSGWDYIIMDCPPSLGVLTVNALTAANEVIIPVESKFMGLSGVTQLLNTVNIVKKNLNSSLTVAGILICIVDNRVLHTKDVEDWLKNQYGSLLFKTHIRTNIRLAEAPSFGEPITVYAADSNGAKDYKDFAQELINMEG